MIDEAQIERCTNDSVTALVESLRFSYAYLFLDDETANRRTFSDRQIMVTDFYNSGLRLIGAILFIIRTGASLPDGIAFAILLANCATPLLNRIHQRPPRSAHD